MFKPCVVIPVYNHEQAIAAVVQGVLAQKLPCILVDYGSGDERAGCSTLWSLPLRKKLSV